MRSVLALILMSATLLLAQVTTTAPLDGAVVDPQGAAIVGAAVVVTNTSNGQTFKASTDERGHWVLPSMAGGNYRVTVSTAGFRTLSIDGVKLDTGVPATVTAKLEVGQVSEKIDVQAGADLVQTTNATLSSTIEGRQIFELPFTSRNALELLVTQAGTQTAGTARNTFINGLPFAAINVTIDGINTQDNYYKSGDGFFSLIPVRTDSMQEVTLETSAAGADSLAQGAAQVKFVTKSGTNEFHGGVFWQHRNTALDANYYFNTINGSPRDQILLNQGGVNVGGPIKRNKLFFFNNYEITRLPISTSATRTVLTPGALDGTFSYKDSANAIRKVNLLSLAGGAGFVGSADPIISSTLKQIDGLTANGILQPRTASNNDYNRNNLVFQPKGMSTGTYDTTKLDYNLNQSNQLSFVWTYYVTNSTPDITNSIVPIYPGTGTILGNPAVAGQRGNRYAGTVSLRSSLRPSLTNEFRAGENRSITLFRDLVSSSALFNTWRGYSPTLNYVTGVTATSGSSRRTSPVKQFNDNVSWIKGKHLVAFGGEFTQINFWYQSVGTAVIPTIAFSGLAANDPINTGATSIFTTANFPGASTTQLGDARNMYAMLTGRVTAINRSVVLNGDTHQYGNVSQIDINRQREWGSFVSDTWRLKPSFTLNLGLRFEQQRPFENLNNTYSSVSVETLYGISGVGNLFKPGVTPGTAPVFEPMKRPYSVPSTFSPSIGFAWQMPGSNGLLSWLTGKEKGKSVLRAGYSIASIREGTYVFQNLYGSNVGLTNSTSVDPGNYPQYFGAPGSVLFRDATLPSRPAPTTPNYPIPALITNSLNGFDPNLRMGYVQSWNLGFQRELAKDTVMEVRYTGNHGLKEWRQVNLNEVNLFESGFLDEFYKAANNLAIANGIPVSMLPYTTTLKSNNFANQGLPGQQDIKMLSTGLTTTNDPTYAQYLRQNRPGSLVGQIYNVTTNMNKLVAAGYPRNLFVANPDVASGGSYMLTNMGSSFYNAMQVEFRRRMKSGLFFQGSYVWAHSIINGAADQLNDFSSPTTFRNTRLDRGPASFDIRHAFKINSIYELPFGHGRKYLTGGPAVARKLIEGWEIAGVGRIQSGTPFNLTSGRTGMNTAEAGVVLYNMTAAQLQSMMQIRKTTGADGIGKVFYLPQDIVDNTNAAFELNNKTLDPSKPYIGPQIIPGQFGNHVFLYGPRQTHIDLSVVKHTRFGEKRSVEFRANFLDALNMTNFFLANAPSSTSFGQTTSAFRDFSGSNDPGARIIEFMLRVNF
jgi:hypothetical protein